MTAQRITHQLSHAGSQERILFNMYISKYTDEMYCFQCISSLHQRDPERPPERSDISSQYDHRLLLEPPSISIQASFFDVVFFTCNTHQADLSNMSSTRPKSLPLILFLSTFYLIPSLPSIFLFIFLVFPFYFTPFNSFPSCFCCFYSSF